MDLNPFCAIFFHPQGIGADPHIALALPPESKLVKEKAEDPSFQHLNTDEMTIRIGRAGPLSGKPPFIYPHQLFQFVLDVPEKRGNITCHQKTIQISAVVSGTRKLKEMVSN